MVKWNEANTSSYNVSNSMVNIKVEKNGQLLSIAHATDIGKDLPTTNLSPLG